MAITYQVVKITGSGVTSITSTGITTSGAPAITISSTSDSGITINKPTDSKSNDYGTAKANLTQGGTRLAVWEKDSAASGASHTFTITYSGSTYPTAFAVVASGVDAAAYDSGSMNSGVSGAGNPFSRPTLGQTQALNGILTFIGTDAGSISSFTNSNGGFSVTQEIDTGQYWCGAVATQNVNTTAAVASGWSVNPGASNGITVSFALKEATGGTAYDLTVDPASYTLTAAAETLVAARNLTVSPASYAVTAQAVNLAVGRVLNVSPTSYTLSAAAVTMAATRALNISPASYALTAADVTLTYAPSLKELVVDPASYTVSAADVSFAVTRALSIDPASYSLTNSAETLSVGRVLSVNPASYALSASAQTLAVGRVLSVDPVAYTLTLADVTLDYRPSNPELIVEPVSYTLSAADVEFEYGRAGGGRDDAKRKIRKRVNELNKKILQAEAQEVTQTAVTKAKSAPKSADQGHDEDEEEALMLLL